MISTYQKEHLETLIAVRCYLESFRHQLPDTIKEELVHYETFRQSVDQFLEVNFKDTCTSICFTKNKSLCCSKEGIVAFFSDMAINALNSSTSQLDALETVLKKSNADVKCVYLEKDGCMWAVRPLVCALFLCEAAEKAILEPNGNLEKQWHGFRRQQRQFNWPDREVLFDLLEKKFRQFGVNVPLMYFHNSPGLLNIKRRAGLE